MPIEQNKTPGALTIFYSLNHKNPQTGKRSFMFASDVNELMEDGSTRLTKAAADNDLTLLQAYIGLGADMNLRDAKGWTALKSAANSGSIAIVKELLSAGAEADACDSETGLTPLMNAAYHGYAEVVHLLIQAGANVRLAEKNYGETALHFVFHSFSSSAENMHDIVKALLAAGAEVNKKNKEGMTPLQVAVQNFNQLWNFSKSCQLKAVPAFFDCINTLLAANASVDPQMIEQLSNSKTLYASSLKLQLIQHMDYSRECTTRMKI